MNSTFADLGVPHEIARRLSERGIDSPFDIQVATIPDALSGRDVCGRAPTGSGKTIAFGIPLVAGVRRAAPKRPKGLVLVPTRELAIQVAEELDKLGDLRVLAVYGGAKIEPQMKAMRSGVDIIVACPGRLLDVIARKAVDLRDVDHVVLDEADRMADMGFLPDVRRILDQTASKRQTLLFSATLDGAVDGLVRAYQTDPVVHEMAEETRGEITHRFWLTADRAERVQVTAEVIERAGPTVVFSRTKHGADRLVRQFSKLGVSAAAIHGNRSQPQRERALRSFHEGEVQALVATDVAARGIHVEGVACVVHFELPADHKDYIHRSGRTGRAGADGSVVGLLGVPERKDAGKLARLAEIDVEITEPAVGDIPLGAGPKASPRRRAAADAAVLDRPSPDGRGAGRGSGGGRRGGGRRPGSGAGNGRPRRSGAARGGGASEGAGNAGTERPRKRRNATQQGAGSGAGAGAGAGAGGSRSRSGGGGGGRSTSAGRPSGAGARGRSGGRSGGRPR